MIEFEGRASLPIVKQPIEVSPTQQELNSIKQLIVFAEIVTMPEFMKATPAIDALIGKLLAKLGLVTVTVSTQQVLVANALAKVRVAALVEVEQVQVDMVPLTRQGLLRVNSVVKLSMRVLGDTMALVSILMAICWLALTSLLEAVTSIMRWPWTRYALNKTINISILLQWILINHLSTNNVLKIVEFSGHSIIFKEQSLFALCLCDLIIITIMNLSLIFLVLIAFLAYLLYDMFKKSRQQQQLAQAGQPTRQTTTRLKPSYQSECNILRQLHDQQTNNLKQKQISIHLQEDQEQPQLDKATEQQVLSLLQTLLQQYRIYVLISRKIPVKNGLISLIKKTGAVEIGFQSNEGAVAVLRQLSCGVHLQSNFQLHKSLSQYLSAIWLAENGKPEGNPQFKSQLNMILGLQSLTKKSGKQAKQQ